MWRKRTIDKTTELIIDTPGPQLCERAKPEADVSLHGTLDLLLSFAVLHTDHVTCTHTRAHTRASERTNGCSGENNFTSHKKHTHAERNLIYTCLMMLFIKIEETKGIMIYSE